MFTSVICVQKLSIHLKLEQSYFGAMQTIRTTPEELPEVFAQPEENFLSE